MEEKKQQYEMGKEMLTSLMEEHGKVSGLIKYYKMILTGETPDGSD